jgi:hypothetical protein
VGSIPAPGTPTRFASCRAAGWARSLDRRRFAARSSGAIPAPGTPDCLQASVLHNLTISLAATLVLFTVFFLAGSASCLRSRSGVRIVHRGPQLAASSIEALSSRMRTTDRAGDG